MDIIKHVDILELIRIHVFRGEPSRKDPLPYMVEIEPLDKTKKIVFDEKALEVLNRKLTEKAQTFEDGRDPRIKDYIQEFVGRMVSELARNGLVGLEDIGDAPEDPYAHIRKQGVRPN